MTKTVHLMLLNRKSHNFQLYDIIIHITPIHFVFSTNLDMGVIILNHTLDLLIQH